jgi:hypothetical protein
MSRLVNFGLGEVCDRLTILALKILYGEAKGVDISHFQRERAALLPKLLASSAGRWTEYFGDLAAVNSALWQAEDCLRAYKNEGERHSHSAEIIECAFRIQEWNDKRAALIQQINGLVGDAAQEKL